MEVFTLEDLSHLSEREAVRSRCESLNQRAIRRYLLGWGPFVALALGINLASEVWLGAAFYGVLFVFSVPLYFAFFRLERRLEKHEGRSRIFHRVTRYLQRFSRATVLTVLVLHSLGLLLGGYFGGDDSGWGFLIPWLFAFFRFSTSEFMLLHGTIVAWGTSEYVLLPLLGGSSPSWGNLIAIVVINLLALALGLFFAARFRRRWRRNWQDALERHSEELRLRQEVDYAREIQLSMLPSESPRLPWLDVSSLSLPAAEVGGDYYDYFELSPQRLAVVAGDVAGHGFASGLLLSGVRSCLTLLSDELADPLAVMVKLDHMVKKTSRRRMLVTLAILLLDEERGEATLTSAGHPPVLVRRGGGGEVTEVEFSSLPLGAGLRREFESRTVPFGPGDLFLLYTDGLYESVDGEGEAYGIERMVEILEQSSEDASARDVRDALLQDLWTYKGDTPQEDDITFVVLKIQPAS